MANLHGTVDVAKSSAVVIYDRQSGDIVHVHEVWTERGTSHPAQRTLQAEALAHAREDHPDLAPARVATLHVEPQALEVPPGSGLRVDVQQRRLTRVAATSRQVRSVGAGPASTIRD